MGVFSVARQGLEAIIGRFGYRLAPIESASMALREFPREQQIIMRRVMPYTMTSRERLAATCAAAEYVARYDIAGDFVECGVWRGGCTMAAALTFLDSGKPLPRLHLFDTFDGMTPPQDVDVKSYGTSAAEIFKEYETAGEKWCYSPLEEVRHNLQSVGYPADRIAFIKGKVEDTIPAQAPDAISVLRLDTDWYESTRHELVHLFPRLTVGGVLIIDDYGDWQGARKAVDEYFAAHPAPMLLNRTDHGGRSGIKLG